MIKNFTPLLFIIIIFAGCDKGPEIPEDTLVKVYTDIIIAQDTTADTTKNIFQINEEVFRRYNITSEQYRKSIDYLNEDPLRWESFFDKAIRYAEDLKRNAEKNG